MVKVVQVNQLLNLLTGLQQFDKGKIIINDISYENKKINWLNKLTYMSQIH